ncbi:MAG: hypothetical protein KIH69_008005 [Anaerolineae bacterium]|nr:hypothetical protein [Anaerolineae bacterium]
MNNTRTTLKMIGGILILVQLADILLHAATHQLEALRVSANLIILIWLTILAFGKVEAKLLSIAIISITGYLLLNLVFLAQNGLTNAQQGGTLRVTLFILVFSSVTLSVWFTHLQQRSN